MSDKSTFVVRQKHDSIDPPPDYSLRVVDTASSSASTSSNPSDLKPSNYTIVTRSKCPDMTIIDRTNSNVIGRWLIDPSLLIPHSYLPPLSEDETEETRKNLSLETTSGKIQADIFVLPPRSGALPPQSRVRINTASKNGAVTTKIHEIPRLDDKGSLPRLPYRITASAYDGSLKLFIPRSFRGPVQLSAQNGSFKYSPEIRKEATTFHEMGGVTRLFIGQFDPEELQNPSLWQGDEMDGQTTNGSIHLSYEDEELCGPGHGEKNFFSKLFKA